MKTVCIIGAGPAGLVAGKTLLQKGGYQVTIFEAADRVGGMWRVQPGEYGDKCSPEMKTNLSRFTVAFSDLAWGNIDLSSSEPPMFPMAWQVGLYLESYAQKFDVDKTILFNNRVTEAKLLDDSHRWEVTCFDDSTKQSSSREYDFLIVASGFFGQPISSFDPSFDGSSPNIQHSSRFRDIFSLTKKAGKILVIGGGISGAEAAASAAFQISSAKHSPGQQKPIHSRSKVFHIISRPFHCLPRYLPRNHDVSTAAPDFLPLDLALYNLSRRPPGEISASISTVPPENAQKGHKFLRSVIGGEEDNLGHPDLVYTENETQYPGYTSITDMYAEFVRSGVIVPVRGWVGFGNVRKDGDEKYTVTAALKSPWTPAPAYGETPTTTINNITGIIEATGYKTNLDFFDDHVKLLLDFDRSCPRIPLLLSRGSIFAKNIHSLAFVGFYEGPYWSVMEMQAQLVAETWSNGLSASPSPAGTSGPDRQAQVERLFRTKDTGDMRVAIKAKSIQVPQFWMNDYVGLVEEFARLSGVPRNDSPFGGRNGPIFSSRYTTDANNKDAAAVTQEVAEIMQAPRHEARFVAPAIFRGLQGVWTVDRCIGMHPEPSRFTGTAHFNPRVPTDPSYSAEYINLEKGTLTLYNGNHVQHTESRIYRYDDTLDKITVWTTQEDGLTAAMLLFTWQSFTPGPEDTKKGWMAAGHHHADPDKYTHESGFCFSGATLVDFGITYENPTTGYAHRSFYDRPGPKN